MIDENIKIDVQPESWKSVKARLRVSITANDVLVAESEDPSLWAKILRVMGDHR